MLLDCSTPAHVVADDLRPQTIDPLANFAYHLHGANC